jgi:hypothetical protein
MLHTRPQSFNLLNLIIERMGDLIRPWVEPLAALLPGLWQAAEGQSLLRIQVRQPLCVGLRLTGSLAPVPVCGRML